MVDCGLDWLEKVQEISPHAIVLTHAHMDHAWGLQHGAPCPVYAPQQCWDTLQKCIIKDRVVLPLREKTDILGISFEAFRVEHSIRCPAVGYKIRTGKECFFYSPDVVYIPDRAEVFAEIGIYIGDGATMSRSMVRKKGDQIFGHAAIPTQLTWCQKENVPRAIFTHCGSEVVTEDPSAIAAKLQTLAEKHEVKAEFAYDGMEMKL